MPADLPSLVAVRTFHAVAERGGIAAAAVHLNVTAGAVRHQIRILEAHVGEQLVHRGRRDFALTAAGRALHEKVAEAFQGLSGAFRKAPVGSSRGELQIACAPALSALRLPKVLATFASLYPLVTLRLHPIEAASGDMDVVISFGERPIAGARRAILKEEAYFPVCGPALLYGNGGIKDGRDLREHVLLHYQDSEDWKRMLWALRQPQLVPRQQFFMPNSHLALAAAREGCGIAIGSTILCADDLRQGTLVKVLDVEIPAPFPYFVIMPGDHPHELATAFVAVLLRELDH